MGMPDAEKNDGLPPRPVPPSDEDCCRSDCVNCVFNVYDRALAAWEEEVERIERARRHESAVPEDHQRVET